jgi:hypothetical protein
LFFSEYVEGTSSYKALEIAAREASTLAGCRLVTYSNGALTGANIALDGVIARGGTYVLCSSSLATLLGDVCQRATNLSFNGDDAVALECEGTALDVIGQIAPAKLRNGRRPRRHGSVRSRARMAGMRRGCFRRPRRQRMCADNAVTSAVWAARLYDLRISA